MPNANRFGDLRRSTLSWCRRTRISASNAARDRNSPIQAHQINLQKSLIASEYQPIRGRGQPFSVCGRDTGRRSTRPGEADIKLVQELGLFDYLSRRLSICGNPDDCLAQARAAKAAGAKRLMLTVSLASDPVRTVELFGEHVLPKL